MSTQTLTFTKPVYLGAANTGPVGASFQERGIGYLMPGSVDDIPVYVSVRSSETNCSVVTHFNKNASPSGAPFFPVSLNAVISAQANNTIKPLTKDVLNVFKMVPMLNKTWDVPLGSFTFTSLSENEKSTILSYGLREEVGRKGTYLGTPSLQNLQSIFKIGPISARASPGNVSLDGYFAYTMAIKGYQIYSSYSHHSLGMAMNMIANNFGRVDANGAVLFKGDGSKYSTVTGIAPVDSMVVHGSLTSYYVPWNTTRIVSGAFTSSGSDLPDVKGIFFPYFVGMNTMDKSTMKHVFEQIFLRSVGDSIPKCVDFNSRMKQGINNFAFTSAGRSLSHLYRGIQLSINNQAPITAVIINSVYHGFVLSGDLTVAMYGRTYLAMSRAEIVEEIGNLNRTSRTLGEIVAEINKPVTEAGAKVYNYSISDINTSRKFYTVYHAIDRSLYEGRLEGSVFKKLVDSLMFTDHFEPPRQSSIHDFIRFVETGDHNILQQYPAYIFAGAFIPSDRVSQGLSIFGATAPSLNYGNQTDRVFTLPRDPQGEDPNLVVGDNGRRLLAYLPFKFLPVRQAQAQWKAVFEKGEFRLPAPPKNKKSDFVNARQVDYSVTADNMVISIYQSIKTISANARAAIRSGKRANRDDDEGDRVNLKRSKKDVMEMDF